MLQSNKPIMEKRRRARINNCLNDLKTLILDAMKKDVSIFTLLIVYFCSFFKHKSTSYMCRNSIFLPYFLNIIYQYYVSSYYKIAQFSY